LDPRAEELATKRLRMFARFCFIWGIFILGRLLQLQIVEHEEYSRLAQQQQERQIEIQAPRGAVLDRNGEALAMSTAVDSVCVNPLRIPDPAIAADILSKILNINGDELLGKIVSAIESKRGFLWVKRKVTPEEAGKLRSLGVEWIEFRIESSRYYPKGQLAAHVLGGVDHEEKGNAGIELALDKELRGTPGVMRTTADVRQAVFDAKVFTDPLPGVNLTLTLDERIQYVAEQALAVAVREHGASTGSLVAMNPQNGDILALANYPAYDPNLPPKSKVEFEARKNLAVTAPFEPGSVFKVVTVAAALETTDLLPSHTFHCGNGAFTLFRRVIHDAKPHGVLSVADIIAKSSNIGAIKIGLRVGNRQMYDYIRAFGFGRPTGLPLPGESSGMLRKPERWIASSIGSIAMGHEISTTTVQLAQACSVIANGGMLVKPRIVLKRQRAGDDAPVDEPEPQRTPVLTPENAKEMRAMMRGVVEHGTGTRAQIRGYSAGGKTGSAQIYDYDARVYTHRYNGSFMGFAPANNPAIVVVVTLNGTRTGSQGFGGVVAAPVFREVAGAALRFLDIPKDRMDDTDVDDASNVESDLAVADLAEPPELEGAEIGLASTVAPAPVQGPELPPVMVPTGPKVPNFQGKTKRAVLAESTALGVRVELAGTGIARAQDPPAGVVLRPGERVRVQFAR
jgi:cell division protein FtsI (penicillin-binding protein 3)